MEIKENEGVGILEKVKAIIMDSHVVYTSGQHGTAYVNKDRIYPHTRLVAELCWKIAESFAFLERIPDIVIAPAIGGVILSQWTAHALSEIASKEVLALYAEKDADGEGFVVKREYDKLLPDKRIVVVEDILTTGGSVKKVVEAVRRLGGNVIGVGAICNRGGVTSADVGSVRKLFALLNVKLDAWDEADCPMCKSGIPINTDVGKGREFLAQKAKMEG
jgi:orotate phosphoribosyltransferase